MKIFFREFLLGRWIQQRFFLRGIFLLGVSASFGEIAFSRQEAFGGVFVGLFWPFEERPLSWNFFFGEQAQPFIANFFSTQEGGKRVAQKVLFWEEFVDFLFDFIVIFFFG